MSKKNATNRTPKAQAAADRATTARTPAAPKLTPADLGRQVDTTLWATILTDANGVRHLRHVSSDLGSAVGELNSLLTRPLFYGDVDANDFRGISITRVSAADIVGITDARKAA